MHKRKGDIIVMRRPLMFSTGITRETDLGGGGTKEEQGRKKKLCSMFETSSSLDAIIILFQAHPSVCVER